MEFVWRHHKVLAHLDAWLISLFAWCIDNLADGQANRVPFVWLFLLRLCDVCFQFVVNSTWFARVPLSWLQCHRCRTVWRKLKVERICISTQLFDKPLLKPSKLARVVVFFYWKYLFIRKKEIFAKGEAENVQVFATITKCSKYVPVNFTVFYVVWIDENDTICGNK